MKTVAPDHLRNVVLAGHAGAGKTTLAEHLLHAAGAINRLGRVEDGTATLDFEPEEQKRKLSLSLAVGVLEHDGHRVTLLDTPGYADFVGEVIEGFLAADAALCVVDASDAVAAGTEAAIGLGRRMGKAALFVITRCERENADPMRAIDQLRTAFGPKIAPLQLAIGAAHLQRLRGPRPSPGATRRASARRSPSRPSWKPRSRCAATSCWKRRPRRTTTS